MVGEGMVDERDRGVVRKDDLRVDGGKCEGDLGEGFGVRGVGVVKRVGDDLMKVFDEGGGVVKVVREDEFVVSWVIEGEGGERGRNSREMRVWGE